MAVLRAKVMLLMRAAVRRGQSRTSFLKDMRAKGLTYPRKVMLSDWGSITQEIAKDGVLRLVRKDAYPAKKSIAVVEWDMRWEYMYKIKVQTRLRPDAPIEERFVNIVTNEPMTPAMMEQAVVEKWSEWEYEPLETIEKIEPWSAFRTTI
ncbi:hypothetical protein ES703_43611 [subsurface metagenome]